MDAENIDNDICKMEICDLCLNEFLTNKKEDELICPSCYF